MTHASASGIARSSSFRLGAFGSGVSRVDRPDNRRVMSSLRSLNSASCTKLMKIFNGTLTRQSVASIYNRGGCGNREVVGYGVNGRFMYFDVTLFPFPAIRFRENTPELLALREKERGDWRQLSIEEKKFLYRASFCQTFAEIEAPTGQWKSVLAFTILTLSAGLWIWIYIHTFVITKAPASFSEESRAAQYWRKEAIDNQPISGNYKPKNADKYKPVDEKPASEEDD